MAAHIQPDIRQRLSSWRQVAHPPPRSPEHLEKVEVTLEEVRLRQHRIASMCLQSVKAYHPFFAELKAFVNNEERDPEHQRRVEDFAAFVLEVYEQSSTLVLQMGVKQVLDNLPREVVHTVYLQPPRKPWFQRLLGR